MISEVHALMVSAAPGSGRAQRSRSLKEADFRQPTVLILGHVVVADLLENRHPNLVGLIAESGTRVSHWCIYARSMGLAAAIVPEGALAGLPEGKEVSIHPELNSISWSTNEDA